MRRFLLNQKELKLTAFSQPVMPKENSLKSAGDSGDRRMTRRGKDTEAAEAKTELTHTEDQTGSKT